MVGECVSVFVAWGKGEWIGAGGRTGDLRGVFIFMMMMLGD
jgi:hypothetical protein